MAIGISKLLGFKITKNFDYPFFSQNIAEFWRKWHISLTTWLTDYVFTPLNIAFRDFGKFGLGLAIVINFTICGIWHGANWNFWLFGFLNGCYFIPLILNGKLNKKVKKTSLTILPRLNEIRNILLTFILVMFTMVIFRSNTIDDSIKYYVKIINFNIFSRPKGLSYENIYTFIFIILLIVIEWFAKDYDHVLEYISKSFNFKVRRFIYYLIIIFIILFNGSSHQYIYMKF
jgi:D-alanyl-lipoteichoic acid acyltransferase DltB (MBOAT superfamily)